MFKSTKYVRLDSRNNVYMVIGLAITAIAIGLLLLSKTYMGDDRVIVSENNGSKIIMPMVEIETHDFYWNKKENFGELRLTETKNNPKSDYDINYVVFDENGNELPYKVIRGSYQKQSKDSIETKQEVYIDFGLYDEFYYVTVQVQQKDSTSENIVMDYRNFKLQNIKEKGDNYLINLEQEEAKLKEYQNKCKPYENKIQEKQEQLDTFDELLPDEKAKKEKEIKKLNDEIVKLQKEMKPYQDKVIAQQKKIDEMREK